MKIVTIYLSFQTGVLMSTKEDILKKVGKLLGKTNITMAVNCYMFPIFLKIPCVQLKAKVKEK